MRQYRSIKEIIDAYYPDMEYQQVSNENLKLSKCPFCGGKKAYINPNPVVNGFKCYSGCCGKQFGFMALYKELSGQLDVKYHDIVSFLDGHLPEEKSYKPVVKNVHEENRANLFQRHKVYKRLLDLLVLDENDKKNLLHRGLTEEQIKKLGYKSCPSKEKIPQIVKTLKKEGFSLVGVPGFFKKNGQYTMMLANGFFVPFHNRNGYIQGLQIRRKGDENVVIQKEISIQDKVNCKISVKNNNLYPINLRILDYVPNQSDIIQNEQCPFGFYQQKNEIRWEKYFLPEEEKTFFYSLKTNKILKTQPKIVIQPRYMWFTSGNKEGGAACMNYTHFIGKLNKVMYLTEGALKADVTYYLCGERKSFIAIAGVTSLRNIPQIFAHLKQNGVEEIRIVLDMDRIYNPVVMSAIDKLKEMAYKANLLVSVPEWDIHMGKGIDDFMLEYLKMKKKIYI